jgi:hypothetical protein
MSERSREEVPFALARGGHRGRDYCARVRDDPGIRSDRTGQASSQQEADRAARTAARRRAGAAFAGMDNHIGASTVKRRVSALEAD